MEKKYVRIDLFIYIIISFATLSLAIYCMVTPREYVADYIKDEPAIIVNQVNLRRDHSVEADLVINEPLSEGTLINYTGKAFVNDKYVWVQIKANNAVKDGGWIEANTAFGYDLGLKQHNYKTEATISLVLFGSFALLAVSKAIEFNKERSVG